MRIYIHKQKFREIEMSHSTQTFDARTLLLCVIAIALAVGWQVFGGGLGVALLGTGSLLAIYLFVKGAFAAGIVGLTALFGRLNATGFAGTIKPMSIVYGIPLIGLALVLGAPLLNGLTLPLTSAIGWAVLALFVAIGEETVFRGIIHRTIAPLGYWATAIITSVSFGAMHLFGLFSAMPSELIIAQSVMAASIGFVFFTVRQSARSLWTVIFLHWLIDTCAFVAHGGIAVPEDVQMAIFGIVGITAVMMAWAIPAMIIQKKRLDRSANSAATSPVRMDLAPAE
jgi:membrane protease YdiL (CAAX protease family)